MDFYIINIYMCVCAKKKIILCPRWVVGFEVCYFTYLENQLGCILK